VASRCTSGDSPCVWAICSNSAAASRVVRFRIRHGEIARDIRLQRTLRKIAAKSLQHDDGSIPLLVLDEQRRRVEVAFARTFEVGANAHAQEIVDRRRTVADLLFCSPCL